MENCKMAKDLKTKTPELKPIPERNGNLTPKNMISVKNSME